jgi:hypothetical protein
MGVRTLPLIIIPSFVALAMLSATFVNSSQRFHYTVQYDGRPIRYVQLEPVAEDRVALGRYVLSDPPWWRMLGGGPNEDVDFETLGVFHVDELFRTDKVSISVESYDSKSARGVRNTIIPYSILGGCFIGTVMFLIRAWRLWAEQRRLQRAISQLKDVSGESV